LIKALLFFLLGSACSWLVELPYGGWLIIPGLGILIHLIFLNKHYFKYGWIFGLGYFCNALWWIFISLHDVGGMVAPLAIFAVFALSAYLAIFPALALKLSSYITHPLWKVLSIASLWTICEWLRGQLFTGFPWAGIAETQVDGPLYAWAPIAGGLACTWAVLAIAGFISQSKKSISTKLIVVVSFISFSQALGFIPFTQAIGEPIEVTLIQGNFPQTLKFDPQHTQNQINFYKKTIEEQKSGLIVAPETALPIPYELLPDSFFTDLHNNNPQKNILLGVVGKSPLGQYSNSALGLQTNKDNYKYDKSHLVPFGEFVPWGFQWFVDAVKTPLGNFHRGPKNQAPFVIEHGNESINAGVMICYEDVFGDEIAARQRDASSKHHLWINLTNLAWFGDSQASEQQLRLAQLRSMETGIPTLRATNTGVTAIVNHRGQVVAQLPEFQQSILKNHVQPYSGITPFVTWGNIPILLLSIGILVLGWQQTKKWSKSL
jgi:apolipoprotein N-acyltransferase